jgi:hypothetical protein
MSGEIGYWDEREKAWVNYVGAGQYVYSAPPPYEALGDTLDEFADKVPGLSPEDALDVLWAVARLADAIESGK